jgi:hypothetical protein
MHKSLKVKKYFEGSSTGQVLQLTSSTQPPTG